MDTGIRFGRIHIIEWLLPNDLKTGRELFDELQPMGLIAKPPVETVFHSVATRAEFVALLRAFEDRYRADGIIPLLQIETHGDQDGIGIGDGEGFDFIELAQQLMPLNQLTGLRLFVVLAACEGLWGMKMSLPSERAAFQVLLGPIRSVTGGEMATAMQAFYRSAFADRNGDSAVNAMNAAIDPAAPTFGPFSAEMGFKMVYREWLAKRFTPEAIERQVDECDAERAGTFLAVNGVERTPQQAALDRERIRAVLLDHEGTFDEFRTRYFMIDLFSDNDARFPVTFASIQVDGPPRAVIAPG